MKGVGSTRRGVDVNEDARGTEMAKKSTADVDEPLERVLFVFVEGEVRDVLVIAPPEHLQESRFPDLTPPSRSTACGGNPRRRLPMRLFRNFAAMPASR